jgi:proline iminopeptidase
MKSIGAKKMWTAIFFGSVLILLVVIFMGLKLYRQPRYISHFEEQEYGADSPFIQPKSIENGLAIYTQGNGPPLLLFPYPHSQNTAPMIQGELGKILVEMGFQVISFDVPGAYRSTREPIGDIDEMLTCALETLERLGIEGRVNIVGHSMGGLSALAFAVEYPEHTNQLVLVGTFSGFPATTRWGMPGSAWKITDLDYWRLIVWGLQVKSGRGSLATHKNLQNLMSEASYYNSMLFEPIPIDPDDHQQGIPIREILWGKNMLGGLDYADRLAEVQASTLIITGLHDPAAPLPCAEELLEGIFGAKLITFDYSGHYPFIEERELFTQTLEAFLQTR